MVQISEQENWPYNAVRYWMEKYKIKTRPGDEACITDIGLGIVITRLLHHINSGRN